MIIQTNLDIASALAPQPQAPSLAPVADITVQNLRFDIALLDAAKTVRDGTEVPETLTLPEPSPRVERALAVLLEGLSQKPVEHLRTLASQPQSLTPALETASQGLNAEEKVELKNLAPLALKRLVQAIDVMEASKTTAKLETSGSISGPQGRMPGTPETLETPIAPVAALKANPVAPETPKVFEAAEPQPTLKPRSQQEDEAPASLASAAAWVPTLVSSRTDSGSGADSSVSLSSRPTEKVQEAAVQAPLSVTVNALKPAEAQAPAAEPLRAGTPTPIQAPVLVAVPMVPMQSSAPAAVQSSPAPSAPQASQAIRPAQAVPSAQSAESRPTATRTEATVANEQVTSPSTAKPAVQAPSQVQDGIEFTADPVVLANNAPAIETDSLITFKSDGSFEGKLSLAPAKAENQTPQVSAPVQAPAAAPTSQAPSPVLSTAAVQVPETGIQVPLPQAAPAVTEAPVPATAPVFTQGQAVPSAELVAKASPQATPSSDVEFEASAAPVFSESADYEPTTRFKASERATFEAPVQAGFSVGHEAVRALATQAARDLGVRETVFKQVGEALSVAGGHENGRLVIKLKPVSLGDVHVDLSLKDGKLTARLIASNVEVRDAFVRDLPSFKAGLESQGVRIDQISVAVRAETNLNQQSQQQPQAQDWWRGLAQEQKGWNAEALAPSGSVWSAPALNPQQFSALA